MQPADCPALPADIKVGTAFKPNDKLVFGVGMACAERWQIENAGPGHVQRFVLNKD